MNFVVRNNLEFVFKTKLQNCSTHLIVILILVLLKINFFSIFMEFGIVIKLNHIINRKCFKIGCLIIWNFELITNLNFF